MISQPLVSVIIPTTKERFAYNERICQVFHRQDYPNKQLLLDFEEVTIGEKRNKLCQKAAGEIICHFDSDDGYQDDWISVCVESLINSNADITGLSSFNLYDPIKKSAWRYTSKGAVRPYVAGATMVYWKALWEQNKFEDRQVGEDVFFLAKPNLKVHAHSYIGGFLATVHEGNTCRKPVNNEVNFTRFSEEEYEELKKEWKDFL